MNRGLLVIIFLSVAVSGSSRNTTQAQRRALYAPRPEYPLAAQERHWTGHGVFACKIRSDGNGGIGRCASKHGSPDVGSGSDYCFSTVEIQPGDMKLVKIPITFWMNGSAVRHRMSGAVIPD
jgi:hypothetical protein